MEKKNSFRKRTLTLNEEQILLLVLIRAKNSSSEISQTCLLIRKLTKNVDNSFDFIDCIKTKDLHATCVLH